MKCNLDGGTELRKRFLVGEYAGGDVPRYADELQLGATVVDSIDARILGEYATYCVGLRWNGHQVRLR